MQINAIEKSLAQQEAASQTASMKKELQELAVQCNEAFIAAGLQDSEHPQVRKALEMCSSHMPCRAVNKEKASPAIAQLWKDQQSVHQTTTDTKQLATSVLGEDLVATLTEDKHQPPDVSLGPNSLKKTVMLHSVCSSTLKTPGYSVAPMYVF